MALVTLNPMFNEVGGKMGNLVYYRRRGTQCVRRHVVPRNPASAAQRALRSCFRDAVHAWQILPDAERSVWNRKAHRMSMSGYNLFLSRYMKEGISVSSASQMAISSGSPSYVPRFPSVPGSFLLQDGFHSASIEVLSSGNG